MSLKDICKICQRPYCRDCMVQHDDENKIFFCHGHELCQHGLWESRCVKCGAEPLNASTQPQVDCLNCGDEGFYQDEKFPEGTKACEECSIELRPISEERWKKNLAIREGAIKRKPRKDRGISTEPGCSKESVVQIVSKIATEEMKNVADDFFELGLKTGYERLEKAIEFLSPDIHKKLKEFGTFDMANDAGVKKFL